MLRICHYFYIGKWEPYQKNKNWLRIETRGHDDTILIFNSSRRVSRHVETNLYLLRDDSEEK